MSAPPSLIGQDAYDDAALLAAALAPVAGDEQAVLARLKTLAETAGMDATRTALARLAVCMFAAWLAPHDPGATVPAHIPTPKENTPHE